LSLRCIADLGAHALVTRDAFGGMAANDGPVRPDAAHGPLMRGLGGLGMQHHGQ
jgi:hypothetical protein